jgi:hypothetical protein
MPAEGAQVDDATAIAMAQPQELIVAEDIKKPAELLKPIDAFYGFWINGSSALLDRALSPHFVDHTLPVPTANPKRLTATANRSILAPDERSEDALSATT